MSYRKLPSYLAAASVFLLIGGGCTNPFASKEPKGPVPASETEKADTSGDTFSEQADIIIDAALDESEFEADAAGNVETDSALFESDEEEMNNLENSYEESEL